MSSSILSGVVVEIFFSVWYFASSIFKSRKMKRKAYYADDPPSTGAIHDRFMNSKILILSFNRIGFLLYIWAVVQEFSIFATERGG